MTKRPNKPPRSKPLDKSIESIEDTKVNDATGVTEKIREFLLFEAGNSRDKTRLLLSMSTVELQLDPVYTEALTPEQFLELYEQGLADIKSVRVIPPKLGS